MLGAVAGSVLGPVAVRPPSVTAQDEERRAPLKKGRMVREHGKGGLTITSRRICDRALLLDITDCCAI